MNRRGISLTEAILAVAIISVLATGAVSLFQTNYKTMPSIEAKTSMKDASDRAMGMMTTELTECKRFFQDNATDQVFFSRLVFSTGTTVLSGSHMPDIEVNGTLTPGTTTFVSASVGNVLFFLALDAPRDVTANNALGVPSTLRIDIYHFTAYFLSADTSSKKIGGASRLVLKRGTSGSYADYAQIMSISDATKRLNAVKALNAAGVVYAIDPAQTAAASAFYTLSSAGAVAASASHTIAMPTENVFSVVTGILGGGYRYGVSPNTSASFNTGNPVPALATVSGSFPGGFEVAVTGPSGSRQVLTRLVLVAQGSFSTTPSHLTTMITSVRDLW